MNVIAAIERERKLRGWSKSHLGRVIGMSPSQIGDLLHGRDGIPKTSTLQRIADAFEIPLSKLIEDDAPGQPSPISSHTERIAALIDKIKDFDAEEIELMLTLTRQRRLLRHIFGHDHEGNPETKAPGKRGKD